jgi:hypothetical protein
VWVHCVSAFREKYSAILTGLHSALPGSWPVAIALSLPSCMLDQWTQ